MIFLGGWLEACSAGCTPRALAGRRGDLHPLISVLAGQSSAWACRGRIYKFRVVYLLPTKVYFTAGNDRELDSQRFSITATC